MGDTGLLLLSDFVLSFMWVCSGVFVKIFVFKFLGFHHDFIGEIVKLCFSLLNLFFFAFLGKIAKGGAYNPLTVLASAISGGFSRFLLSVGARIPTQVLGAIYGVKFLIYMFPEIGKGPKLNVNIHQGALTEGLLTFMIVSISLSLARSIPGSFVRKTWISSLSKLTLNILGSDLTGGCMNPASVMGWAYARGDHITKEHIFVYWLAPIEATLLAVWIFMVLFPKAKEKSDTKPKSE
ncbi:probable aquaporin SIP2-1 [Beta vulgaris subsp. vulgaris]|uniref:probable aquaporin SIP2-1 n=1 Tax=Beta vulgaris subsp. vulgaris TaxID=3555 RepID=UPI0020373C9A|nr:probable aquaporin SIP2-1 [Beta vulgaris subsp. vulgaris]